MERLAGSTGREALVEARGVVVEFGRRRVLDDVSVAIGRGEIVTLIGVNGSGKTTLVRVLLGLLAPTAGRVIRRPGITVGYTPQRMPRDPSLPLTVGRFLTLGGRASRDRIAAALAEVGCEHLWRSQIADLSGGELRRAALARALLHRPDLLVLDEPTSGVDVSGRSELYRLVSDLRDRHGCGVLLVSHDIHVVMAAADRVVCLNGHVCCTGHPRAVLEDPAFIALFGPHAADGLALYRHHHDHRHDTRGAVVPLGAGDDAAG